MKTNNNHYILLTWRIALLFLLFTLCRIGFFLFNSDLYPDMTFVRFLRIAGGGLRFDLTAIIYTNLLYIVVALLPFPFIYTRPAQTALKALFVTANSIVLAFNIADMAYFRFTLRRTSFSFFQEFSHDNNMGDIITASFTSYWYLVLLWIAMTVALWRCYGKWQYTRKVFYSTQSLILHYALRTVALAAGFGLCVAGARGGFRTSTRPITLSNAGVYVTQPLETYVVLNTPFCIYRTIGKAPFKPRHFFDTEEALDKIYTPIHQPAPEEAFRADNVVVIILESFARYHIGALNPDIPGMVSYTPFLDSLIRHSHACSHAFANGTKSIDAIPSILGSIPTLEEPYVLTPYALNEVEGLGALLRRKGYHTSFFHGAQNNSMGFSSIVNLLGFAHYFGRTEYNNDSDFDNIWGIWDEPFLQFYARTLNTFPQPFASALFTLSSHHPFKVPAHLEGKFPKGTLPVHQCIGYTDYALRRFFDTASTMPWFHNTLFVLTADHSIWSDLYAEYSNPVNALAVPIIYYHPGLKQAVLDTIPTQQINIMPAILRHLHYDLPYFAYGHAADSTAQPFVVTYNGGYQLLCDNYLLLSDGEKSTGFYRWAHRGFKGLGENLLGTLPDEQEKAETLLRAFLQQYSNRMIENRLTINK
jgi:phosphoglycerol transferase MdoB-like AlkP superfamily enzyme